MARKTTESDEDLLGRVQGAVEGEDGDGDTLEVGAPVDDGDGPSRADKKRERPGLMQALEEQRQENARLRQQWEAEREQQRRESELSRREMDELRRKISERHAASDDGDSGYESQISQLDDESDTILQTISARRAAGALTAEEVAGYNKRLREIGRKQTALQTEHLLEQRERGRQMTPEQQRVAEIQNGLRARWPDVYANRSAVVWASGRYQQLAAEMGRAPTESEQQQMSAQAHDEARARFQTGTTDPPDIDRQRRRTRGEGRAQPGGSAPKRVRVTPMLREMALEHYSHLDSLTDEQKVQKLINETPGLAERSGA